MDMSRGRALDDGRDGGRKDGWGFVVVKVVVMVWSGRRYEA